jgi:phosphatidylglycerophosphate synthase
MSLVLYSLIFHGVLGGLDVILNHEIVERLPQQPSARTEEALHGVRELLFGLLFLSLAWGEWHGLFSWAIVLIIFFEVTVSTYDSLVEDWTRHLPSAERVMHIILFMNVGFYTALLLPIWIKWHGMPTQLQFVNHGMPSVVLSVLATAAFFWSIRDAISYFRLRLLHQ